MKLVIGGAYQGKLDYARKTYTDMSIVEDFHLKVLDMLKNDVDPMTHVKENIEINRDTVIICDDIFSGVVPIDPLMRRWREELGRVCAYISAESDEVVRLFCSIPTRLK